MKLTIAASIRMNNYRKPLTLRKCEDYIHGGLFEVLAARWPINHYVSFNGNSKQRRQQRRKLIRDLNES